MTTTRKEYVPGVCNIGPAEIRRRRQSGWLGLAVTIIAGAVLLLFRVPSPWLLLLFLPATLGATGFFQAAFHFCANFGMRGVFNFGPDVGKTDTVEQAEFRAKDRRRAKLIGLYSMLVGAAVAIAGLFAARA
ncbi:MAG: hypothetical protein ABSG63_15940 [Spirochaetia bacterium]|jgi:hypothetical protein